MQEILVLDSVAEAHQFLGLPKPSHPLVSVIRTTDMHFKQLTESVRLRIDLFQIWIKEGADCEFGYGRSTYDFKEGTLAFIKAGQVITADSHEFNPKPDNYLLLFHPDLIRKSALGENIKEYGFFDYETDEALHVSEAEQKALLDIIQKIEWEIQHPIDRHSQRLIVNSIELFLDYALRYYDRQFFVRTNRNQEIVGRVEKLLQKFFESDDLIGKGLPTVKYLGENLNMSPSYLSDMLRKETGRNAQEFIHHALLEKAKNQLLGSTDPVSQIAYDLGFEYPQHFSKLFKSKTGLTPLEYRNQN